MKIIADDKIPFLKGVFEPFGVVVYLPGVDIKKSHLKDADALLTRSITKCNAELLECTALKLIASATIGDDHIDKEFCLTNNIKWVTAQGCNAHAVVQYVFAGLLSICEKSKINLRNKTIGIIGAGNIGTKVEKICRAIGMRVLLNDPPRERKEGQSGFSGFDEIQSDADIISIHVPLNLGGKDNTFHLIDQQFIEKTKKPVVLINTSRGPVVESKALKCGINQRKIAHAIVDVWEGEPDIDSEVLELAAIGTPHIAGYSIEGKAKATEMVVHSLSEFFHLQLNKWKPETDLKDIILDIDLKGLTEHQAIQKVYRMVYDILKDDELLRKSPSDFEHIRGSYILRRENSAHILNLKNPNQNTVQVLSELGFRIEK
jgi:erythronate-4-phosphate dehydrogenase